MAAYRSGVKKVLLGSEIGRDEGKDIRWDAVDESERVLPLADDCQRA